MSHYPRILVLTTSYPIKGISDAGHFVQSECQLLHDQKLKITVLAPAHPEKQGGSHEDGFLVHRFKYFFPSFLQKVAYGAGIPSNLKHSLMAKIQLPFFMFFFYLRALKLAKNADVIHAHWFPAGLIAALVKKKNQRLVLTMHHGHKGNLIYRWILKKTDYLLCNSRYTQEMTSKIFDVKEQRVFKIGIDTAQFKHSERIEKNFNILFVGRFIELKGVQVLLNAFQRFKRITGTEKAKLILVGDGPMKEELKKLAQTLQISENIEWKGYVKRSELPIIYNNSSVFVIPSIQMETGETEGLGLTALEAFACALPVIGSKSGGIIDIVEDGRCGFLTEPGNPEDLAEKLHTLFQDQDLAKNMGALGRKKVEEDFNILNNKKALFEAYHISIE